MTLRRLTAMVVATMALSACAMFPDAATVEPAAETAEATTDEAGLAALDDLTEDDAPAFMSAARALHERLLVMDTHMDTPILLERPGFDITQRYDAATDYSQVDLPRMIEGGLDGGFWVIYTGQGPLTEEAYRAARDAALMRAVAIQRMVAANPDDFALATKPEDAERIHAEGKRIVYQSIENSYPLGEDVSLLETFYDLGVRMVGPVHFSNNQFADSGTDAKGEIHGGLSELGKALVKEANRLGMILDHSHASDAVFDDLIELSATPIILSHSGVRALYDHPRNTDDARLLTLKENGGVIHINAFGGYLKALETVPGRQEAISEVFAALRALGPDATEAEYQAVLEMRRAVDAEFPPAKADFEDFMEQLLYALDLLGPDHVGIGADFDGGGGVIGMEDATAFPKITERLLEEGYTETDLEKIWGGNVLRLLAAAEDHAEALRAEAMAEAQAAAEAAAAEAAGDSADTDGGDDD